MNEYISYRHFMIKRNLLNITKPVNYICLLRDKDLFSRYLKACGISVVENIGLLYNNCIYKEDHREVINSDFVQFIKDNAPLFIKQENGECGKGVFSIENLNGSYLVNGVMCNDIDLRNLFDSSSHYVIQKKIVQHPAMNRLYPGCVNTLRIITVRNDKGDIDLYNITLRVGVNDSTVDNWAKGGLIVGAFPDGSLSEFGYYKPGYGTICTSHPNTNIEFSKFKIPYITECIDLCISAHNTMKHIHSIGWDVAIGLNGPVLIEGNDNWEISLPQVCFGPQKRRFDNYFNVKVGPNI